MSRALEVIATIFAGIVVFAMAIIDWLLWLLVPIAIIIMFFMQR